MPYAALLGVRWDAVDAERVLAEIFRQSLCVPCIVERSRIGPAFVESILEAVGEALGIRRTLEPCEACKQTAYVYRLG